jgi:hypothetical protein
MNYIAEDRTDIDFNEIAQLFAIHEKELWRKNGAVDLLIGVDDATLHTGITKQITQPVQESLILVG